MARAGRNARCTCGSGKKVKHCCGERKGPSEAELTWAYLAQEKRAVAPVLRSCSRDEIHELWHEVMDLPETEQSLQLMPSLFTPQDEALVSAMKDDDIDAFDAVLPSVLAHFDTPVVRKDLARAVLDLRDAGRVPDEVAAVALVELADREPSELVASAVIHGFGVAAGELRTPAGLRLGTR
jgi:hypothetical protein